ncbi:MAG: HD domain-containing protein [Candidatus Azobacteroides pseudotrichonymphae]|jgi:HD superfamily phosphohydrolase|uniref:HD/PDEase domain-containing protein n=1 Tax=Azobacteroides pseudotrichonymphae genomovar. CFP2 TaxID=511995 RepID=B6YRE0_AZOPC|nr:HD domain-containing protein [Candidatus Azobacteroides pseudotrichonymphae]MDR0530235.1 HD domain-containing protein [Bacteroidales bacterium OttesenSCG-928-I14]BAG83762.1 conserved hypothetical protein [Candidatus Azobacteroides pseudotrichonymphae genomovar. CFP2]GMO35172.1 MAG: HD domain-containing protein [Candidatus Azobacteroides pseudotrichonymphae]
MKICHPKKIINDPVFGFININDEFIYNIIQHPYLQRLTRIRQLGLTYLVYPGAQHSRMNHSLGAMYLMNEAIVQLRSKGHSITLQEAQASLACALMHDLGHTPFSHALENTLVKNIHHEAISLLLIEKINKKIRGKLDLTISLFKNEYPKKFFHQLISGQLDIDRLDYLRRDSFFSGVTEGNIGSARIIKMLNIKDDCLVIDSKGIYSIENFLMARQLMFWQVYLHKTVIASGKMLINLFNRARQLTQKGIKLFTSPALHYFLSQSVDKSTFQNDPQAIEHFVNLDDNDILSVMKVWSQHSDRVLSLLSSSLLHRKLFQIEIKSTPFNPADIEKKQKQIANNHHISFQEASYLIAHDEISTNIYNEADDSIDILYKDGTTRNIAEVSDMLNIRLLSKKIKKYYLCLLRN